MSQLKRTPTDLLKQLLGRQVCVKTSHEIVYIGTLICLDGQMNLCLENIEVYEDQTLIQKYEQAFLRGNNVLYVSTKNTV